MHLQKSKVQTVPKVTPQPNKAKAENIDIPKPLLPSAKKVEDDKQTNKVTERPSVPHASPLPFLEEKTQLVDPPNFDDMVNELVGSGFEHADCVKALRAAVYNPNRAAEFLLSNYIPDLPQLYDISKGTDEAGGEEEDFVSDEEEDDKESFSELVNSLRQDPGFLQFYLQEIADNNPSVAHLIKEDPAAFIVSLGLNPKDFDLSSMKAKTDYEKYMEQFSEEEQQAIHRLEKLGFDTMIVIQVYEACGRDENSALSCLMDMK